MAIPPPGFMMPGQQYPSIQPYPGDNFINSSSAFQYGPYFDGQYAHRTQNVPYMNYLLEDVNAMQDSIFKSYGPGFGYPPMCPPMMNSYMGPPVR
jgi:hypothetical protein